MQPLVTIMLTLLFASKASRAFITKSPLVSSNKSLFRLFSSSSSSPIVDLLDLLPGSKIQVEVMSFGPMGASVDVVALSHKPEDVISESDPALATGLILQREIHYFREARENLDVVQGEILPAYCGKIREDGKIDVSLRAFGGKAKAEDVAGRIMERLEWMNGGTIDIGDKSSPEEIARVFPGVSKGNFKKAVGALYKDGKVNPGPTSISLI
jgi:hypothetical protein